PAHRSPRTFPGDSKTGHYDEELFVGYRHFDKFDIEPLFPFGHGLSYTRFDYAEPAVNGEVFRDGADIEVSLRLTNTGPFAGAEVVQLYVAATGAPQDRPEKALKGFSKVALQPGESREVTLRLPVADLAVYCPEQHQWQVDAGRYELQLGSSSRDIRQRLPITIAAGDAGSLEVS
ncbi:MAG: fibronectin type III-like domain-contianing protein, partial [Halioglobus sp.]|nr:fibronectin type III-like domain-contianing protein [Halioglobus sp.]